MAVNIKAPRGTQDILPTQSYKWQFVEKIMFEVAALYGYGEIRTPTFETLDLFKRSVGDTTDVVQKEMYQVKADKGDEVFGLRPEGTAGVVRAILEKGLLNDALPLKLAYNISCFRHERPQAGRYREFRQFGVELFGASNPSADAEVISLVKNIFEMLNLTNISININSIGCPTCRSAYTAKLIEFFKASEDKLCTTCLDRMSKNPMRILDCKSPVCAEIAKDAPVMIDYLCQECDTHFDGVKTRLEAMDIAYKVNTKIVRGLDYYTKTVFEFICSDLGAQSTICGGGRYDGLVAQLGGNPTAGLGFGIGIDRVLLALDTQKVDIPKPADCELYIASMGDKANIKAIEIISRLRQDGFNAECDLVGRSLKAQMKYANKINATFSMVLGDDELASKRANLKNMETGETIEVDFEDALSDILYDAGMQKVALEMAEEFGDTELFNLINPVQE